MKKSTTPTDWLLIKASVESDFDSVDFVLVNTTPEFLETIKRRAKYIKDVPAEERPYMITFWDYLSKGYYIAGSEDTDLADELDEMLFGTDREEWFFVETNEAEIAKLQVPDSTLDVYVLKITREGEFFFDCLGKHTDERFYTKRVSLEELSSKYSNKLTT